MKRCRVCGREDTKGFEKHGHGFQLKGRTRLAQHLNMRGKPIWECAQGIGCKAPGIVTEEVFQAIKDIGSR